MTKDSAAPTRQRIRFWWLPEVLSFGGKFPQVPRPMWIDVRGHRESLGVVRDHGWVVDPELESDVGGFREAAVIVTIESIANNLGNEGSQGRCLGVLPPRSLGDLARAAQHPGAAMTAGSPAPVEEIGVAVEHELHDFAVGVDRLMGDAHELSIVVPDDVRQSRPESGILDAGYELCKKRWTGRPADRPGSCFAGHS